MWRGLRARLRMLFTDSQPRPIADVIAEMSARSPRVGRAEALTVPAMLRGRNMICSIATLPLVQVNSRNEAVRNPLLDQLDPDVPNVVTLAQTIEDLMFESIAWWKITAQDFAGYPIAIRHLDVSQVSLNPPTAAGYLDPLPGGYDPRGVPYVYVDGLPTPADTVIRFDSPNPPVLRAAGRAIRKAILLDKAASMYADDPRPLDYFTPSDGADPVEDDEVADILAKWKAARKRRSTAYVPASLKYNSVDSPSPADLQLLELQRQAGLEIANALGVDPEDLGISTTSRTYSNVIDRRQDRINEVLSPYMCAITQRLSMGDVTRRGHRVLFDLDNYLKANPTDRWSVYKTAKDIGAITVDEIRAEENLPPLPPEAQPAPTPAPSDPTADPTVTDPAGSLTAARPRATFDGAEPLRFVDVPVQGFTVDRGRRIIEGLALPYNATANKYGLKFKFVRGALKWTSVNRVKLLRDHDMNQAIGVATNLTDTADGLRVKFKVARGPAGDEALSLAEDGVLDGLSVGVDFDTMADTTMDPNDDGTMLVHRADLRETSLTAMPAFDDARVTKVAASRAGTGGNMDPCATCGQVHAAGVACPSNPTPQPASTPAPPAGLTLTDEQARALLTRPGALQALVSTPAPANPPASDGGFTLSAEQLDSLIASGGIGALLGIPGLGGRAPQQRQDQEPGRQVVNPTRQTASTSVREELPYRFDRKGNLQRGVQYDFSTDVINGLRDRDEEALNRAQQFIAAKFDTRVADVDELNPNIQRPDLYVDQKDFAYPIWDAIDKGTLTDITPFILPKFNASSGLVAAHSEGTEPSVGAFTSTSQTITPSAVSGKVSISRESWDQGGNPQLSGLIWRQMTRGWYEALEAAAVTALEALAPTTITLTLASQDDVLVGDLQAALAALQYVRGGFRMRDFFLQVDLYKKLVAAADANGRPLLPRLNPFNANGSISDYYGDLDLGGLRGRPAWATAASAPTATNSFMFDRNDVSGWASAPQRLTFEQVEVRYVHIGIWGYKAIANTDLTGVRKISYGPGA